MGIPLTVGYRPSRSLRLSRSLSQIFLSHDGISAIIEPFHDFFFHTMEFRLSQSLFFFHTMEFRLSQSLFT
jgi:hypothetical protein